MPITSLAVFVHYDRHDRLADYVLEYVRALQTEVDHLIFVSTARLSKKEQSRLKKNADQLIVRENVGYDFMSWQVGLQAAGDLSRYDEVIIANDSCYAPLFPLKDFLEKMRATKADFWGVTDSHEVAYHLQSYFMGFSKPVVVSPVFKQFWRSIKVEEQKMDVVRKYEVGLSQQLIASGFKPVAFCNLAQPAGVQQQARRDLLISFARTMFREVRRDWRGFLRKALNLPRVVANRRNILRRNPSLYGWRQGLLQQSPFIKVMLIRDQIYPGARRSDYLQAIKSVSQYDTGMIERHLEQGN